MARIKEENFVKSFVDIWNNLVKKEKVAGSNEVYCLVAAFYCRYICINANHREKCNGKTVEK